MVLKHTLVDSCVLLMGVYQINEKKRSRSGIKQDKHFAQLYTLIKLCTLSIRLKGMRLCTIQGCCHTSVWQLGQKETYCASVASGLQADQSSNQQQPSLYTLLFINIQCLTRFYISFAQTKMDNIQSERGSDLDF